MKRYLTRFLSLLLIAAMLMGSLCLPTGAAEVTAGTNGRNIYLSLSVYSDKNGTDPLTAVPAGSDFYVFVNFSGNPTVLDESVLAYDLLIGYDDAKMTFHNTKGSELTDPTRNPTFARGVAYYGWASLDGILDEDEENIAAAGRLFRIKATAVTALSAEDLQAISFLTSATGTQNTQSTGFYDKNQKPFTVISLPALAIGALTGAVYSDASPEQIRGLISAFRYTDAEGKETVYTPTDAAFIRLSVVLPAAGLKPGANTVTAVFDGCSATFTLQVMDRIQSIYVTAPPTKTAYTAYELFDPAGMTVVAWYESGRSEDVTASCTATPAVPLTVGVTSVAVSYQGMTAPVAVSVSPRRLPKPVASSAALTYDGSLKAFAYAVSPDTNYVTVAGNLVGTDAGQYSALAALKDKVNTVWADGSTDNVTLTWHIAPAALAAGFAPMTYRYTTVYADLPTTAILAGNGGETVEAAVTWYSDGTYTQPAVPAAQLAPAYTGAGQTVTLYYRLSGMTNYVDYLGSVSVSLTDKVRGSIEWTGLPAGLTAFAGGAVGEYREGGYSVTAGQFTVRAGNGTVIAGTPTFSVVDALGQPVSAMKDAGTYTVRAFYADKDNQASASFTVVISPKAIIDADFTFDLADKTYTGSEIKPAATTKLTAADYTVAYATNVNAGKATITVTGQGNYTGTLTKSFTILPKAIAEGDFTFDLADKTYTGGEIKPAVTSKLGADDYTVAYANNRNVGKATVTVTGRGNYTGSIVKSFSIVGKLITEADFTLDLTDKTYTGSEIKPAVTSTLGAGDYTVTYAANVNAGTARITVTGKGNYGGSFTKTFTIQPKAITEADFTLDLTDKTYTGGEIKPAVISTLGAGDYTVAYAANINAGKASITVTGQGNYTGTLTKSFTIQPKAFNGTEFSVSGLLGGFTYTGSAIEPAFTLVWNGKTLVRGTDYTAVFSDNLLPGTAVLTLTGQENFSGTHTATFTIQPIVYSGAVTVGSNTQAVKVGTELTASAPVGDTLSYRWKRNGQTIPGAVSAVYTVTEADAGTVLTVEVTSSGTVAGTLTGPSVAVDKMLLPGTLTLSGTATVIAEISGAPAASHYTLVWMRDGVPMPDISGTAYTVTDADRGCAITAKLVAVGTVYTGEVLSGNAVNVPAVPPSFPQVPAVTAGNGQITVSFSAVANGTPITGYQILVNGAVAADLDAQRTDCIIDGLNNGMAYRIQVAALSAAGIGYSQVVSATPIDPLPSVILPILAQKYPITVAPSAGGTVTSSADEIRAGKTVVLSIEPDMGYRLVSLEVFNANGTGVRVTVTDGKYSFNMPAGAVLVKASFVFDSSLVSLRFTDVPAGAYYADAVKWAVAHGVTNGVTETAFAPDASCTRAQTITFLWRAAGSPKPKTAQNPFRDVKADSYYYDAVLWAVENGITTGTTAETFSPDATVTRAQTVTFLWRMAGSPGVKTNAVFRDVKSGDYFAQAVAWAYAESITTGMSADLFGVGDACTRGQMVTFIYRYFS